MVVTGKKSGELRVCLDPKPLNFALKREHFQLPILDDVLPELTKAKIFSSVDLRNGYHHVLLDDESSLLTTFATPYRRYRYLRLPFGPSVSSEILQKKVLAAVGDLPGVLRIADDSIVYNFGDTHVDSPKDQKLVRLLERCRQVGFRLNAEKLKLRQNSIVFLGHLVSSEGLKPDPVKVKAVDKLPVPTGVEAVQRVNGFVNYLAKFFPRLSDVIEALRKLTRADAEWPWGQKQDNAFQEIKNLVSTAPILRYCDPKKELTI